LANCHPSRTRRVKCDETKPECLRCSNFGRKCGGYPKKEESPPPKGPTVPVPRRLLSKAMQIAAAPSRSPTPTIVLPTAPPSFRPLLPPGVVFQDEREFQYFCHFRDETAFELSSGFEPKLWSVLVLNACDIPSIRQLVVATAALNIAVHAYHSDFRDTDQSSHHQYALQQYDQALKGIQEMVATGQDSTRVALISALLIFCLEGLQGECGRAVGHAQSAIDMIVKRISNVPDSFYFSRINSVSGQKSTALDEELLTAFMRLDRPSLTLLSKRNQGPQAPANRIFDILFSQEHLEIPRGFATTAEARVYLEDIKWRILSASEPPESITVSWNLEMNTTDNSDLEALPLQLKQWYEASQALNSSTDLTLELSHWHDAFSSILNYSMTPGGDSIFVAAVILHIQALSSSLLVSKSLSSSQRGNVGSGSTSAHHEEDMEKLSTVRAIISFSRRLVAHPKFLRGFVFDVGIIPSLVHVWTLCPDRQMKIDAIEVLKSMVPRKEAFWDSSTAAIAGQKYLEREFMEPGVDMIDPSLLIGM
jgi:hypothetical protein